MIYDLEYTTEWLQSGKESGTRRGADRRNVYKRTILSDPRLIDALSEEHAIIWKTDGVLSECDQ